MLTISGLKNRSDCLPLEVDTCSKRFLHLLNAVMEADLLDIQSVEIASSVREESEVNQLTYFKTILTYTGT